MNLSFARATLWQNFVSGGDRLWEFGMLLANKQARLRLSPRNRKKKEDIIHFLLCPHFTKATHSFWVIPSRDQPYMSAHVKMVFVVVLSHEIVASHCLDATLKVPLIPPISSIINYKIQNSNSFYYQLFCLRNSHIF